MWWDEISTDEGGFVHFQGEAIYDPMFADLAMLWKAIGEVLQNYLDLPVAPHEILSAAACIGSHFEGTGDVWENLSQKYGTNAPDQALKRLEAARADLEKIKVHRSRGGTVTHSSLEDVRSNIREASGVLWRDVRRRVLVGDIDEIDQAIDILAGFFDTYLDDSRKPAAKHHPFHVATCLRAVFERFSTHKITAGFKTRSGSRSDGVRLKEETSGSFCQCLCELFEQIGIDANGRYYAGKARELAADDAFLVDRQLALEGAADRMREFAPALGGSPPRY